MGGADTRTETRAERERTNKPPIPPTKAAAVAKIRETIAQAKRESSRDLSQTVPAITLQLEKTNKCLGEREDWRPVRQRDWKTIIGRRPLHPLRVRPLLQTRE